MPWHYTVDRRVSEFASFSTRGRDSRNYYVCGRCIIGTRHAPCPKYGAQMTTMMNTLRGIHDGLQNRLAHAADHLRTDWRKDIGKDSSRVKALVGQSSERPSSQSAKSVPYRIEF